MTECSNKTNNGPVYFFIACATLVLILAFGSMAVVDLAKAGMFRQQPSNVESVK